MRYLIVLMTFFLSSTAMTQPILPTKKMMAGIIDHTYLKSEAEGVSLAEQNQEIDKLVVEAHTLGAYSVCVRENMVSRARQQLDSLGSKVKLVSVVGFPNGNRFSTEEKIKLVRQARLDGADEYDMVMRYDDFKNGEDKKVSRDIVEVSNEVGDQVLKVIVETAYLSVEQRKDAYGLIVNAFHDSLRNINVKTQKRFLKTSTGFAQVGPGTSVGATLEDVAEMHAASLGKFGIKPAGGVGSYEDAVAFFQAVGSPIDQSTKGIDPYKFRIGSSSLLQKLFPGKSQSESDY